MVGGITTDSGRSHNGVTGTRAVMDTNANKQPVVALTLALLGGGQLQSERTMIDLTEARDVR